MDKPSSFLEIHLTDSRYESQVVEIVRLSTRERDILISSRELVLLLEFRSSLEAVEGRDVLLKSTKNEEGVKFVSLVTIAEFCQITCRYQNIVPVRGIVELPLDVAETVEGISIILVRNF